MPGAAGYDPQDPTWMRESGADDERPRLDEIEPPGPLRLPFRVEPDPWQRREDDRDAR